MFEKEAIVLITFYTVVGFLVIFGIPFAIISLIPKNKLKKIREQRNLDYKIKKIKVDIQNRKNKAEQKKYLKG